ncbi:hypothetical protein FA13DRAFT_1732235 [Coprinellus micaceus]|nr:hypothetical protein FA13DRAFT_1732235 [Coprinellus micaceus]
MGGLTEDDLEDERPTPEAHPTSFRTPVGGPAPTNAAVKVVFANDRNLKRNKKRQNFDIAIVAAPQPGTRTTRAPASALKPKSSTIQKQSAPPLKAPAPTNSTALPEKPKGLPTKPKKLVQPSKARPKLTANSVRKSDLPDFTQASNKWTENYLPTVFHMYYHASEHFVTWGSNSKTLNEAIQGAVDLVYPDEEYQVGMVGDPIQLLTYNRISERRSNLGSDAVLLLQEHLGKIKENPSPDYDGLSEVHDWLEWARRDTGPLFFERPTPVHCTADVGEPGFVMPGGRLRSQFIINLVRNALSCSTGSLYTCDTTPVGLFALIMAALERAAKWLQPDGTMHQDAQPFS